MTADASEAFAKAIVARVGEIADRRTKFDKLEDALEAERGPLMAVWTAVADGAASGTEGAAMAALVVAAAMRGSSAKDTEQLRALVQAFSTWMSVFADEIAPALPRDTKAAIVRQIWDIAVAFF
jgi:hypothetical protein